jgi:hypothetical protein
MRRTKSALSCAFLLALAALGSARAYAQPADPATAEALFRQGRDALARGDYAAACPKFVESQRLDPSIGALMNIADCEEHDGHLTKAWELWHEAIDQLLHANDDRVAVARVRAEAVDKRIPRLTLRLDGENPGARLARDGIELGRASLGVPLPVDPGSHLVTVTMAGHRDAEWSVKLAEGEARELVLDVGSVLEPEPRASQRGDAKRTVGFVAVGVAGAALVVTAVSGLVVLNDKSIVDSECGPGKGCSQQGVDAAGQGKTWLAVNTVAAAVTIVSAGLGAVLILTSNPKATTSVVATTLPSGGGLVLRRSF